MASPRYTLNIKPEDLQPEQPKHEMTGKEKRENFWFYHKWHVIVGIVAALMVFSFVWEIATQVHPDYTIGILTTTGVPMGTGEALAEQLKPYFDDRNGDGEVVVSVMEYTIGKDADSIADPNVQMGEHHEVVRRHRRRREHAVPCGRYGVFPGAVYAVRLQRRHISRRGQKSRTMRAWACAGETVRRSRRWSWARRRTSDGSQWYDYQTFLQDYKLVPRVYTGTKLEKDEDAGRVLRKGDVGVPYSDAAVNERKRRKAYASLAVDPDGCGGRGAGDSGRAGAGGSGGQPFQAAPGAAYAHPAHAEPGTAAFTAVESRRGARCSLGAEIKSRSPAGFSRRLQPLFIGLQ